MVGGLVFLADTNDLKQALSMRSKFNLDFDDAYQYIAASKYHYTIISFDSDFDRTQMGRITPAQASRMVS
jgi:hypothetical protein